MPRVEETVVIDRPRQDVFAFVTTPENDVLWLSTAVERKRESETIAVGTTITAVDRFLGRRLESTFEITEYEPDSRLGFKTTSGPLQFTGNYTLGSADGGTRFTLALDAETGLGGLFGKLTDPIVTRMFSRQVHADLEKLKDLLEAHAEGER